MIDPSNAKSFLFGLVVAIGLVLLGFWFLVPAGPSVTLRVPIPENSLLLAKEEIPENVNLGTLIPGNGHPSQDRGSWPQFRGPTREAIANGTGIASSWPESGPRLVWEIELGEGHAGAAIHGGRVFLLDHDKEKKEDVVRCLSLDSAEEIWRYTYYAKVKRNHGMSRTVPAVNDRFLVTLGPKCHVHCLAPETDKGVVLANDKPAVFGRKEDGQAQIKVPKQAEGTL